MGDYLNEMNKRNVGDAKVKSALKDLKDLHRNPLIHPEDTLSMDEAVALMSGIYTVMVHMLKAMPIPNATLPLPWAGVQEVDEQLAVPALEPPIELTSADGSS
jgi:hypothetical protein